MSRYLPEAEARELVNALDSGQPTEIGEAAPCAESKWMGWRVVRSSGRLYAMVTPLCDCVVEITVTELPLYVDDVVDALANMGEVKP